MDCKRPDPRACSDPLDHFERMTNERRFLAGGALGLRPGGLDCGTGNADIRPGESAGGRGRAFATSDGKQDHGRHRLPGPGPRDARGERSRRRRHARAAGYPPARPGRGMPRFIPRAADGLRVLSTRFRTRAVKDGYPQERSGRRKSSSTSCGPMRRGCKRRSKSSNRTSSTSRNWADSRAQRSPD